MGISAIPPGGNRAWTDFLPGPYDTNPLVVVVMVPNEAKLVVRECSEGPFKGVRMATMQIPESESREAKEIPLAFCQKDYGNYFQQRKMMTEMGGNFAPPAHIGLIQDMPQKLTMSADFYPLLFLRDAPHEIALDLRASAQNITKQGGYNG